MILIAKERMFVAAYQEPGEHEGCLLVPFTLYLGACAQPVGKPYLGEHKAGATFQARGLPPSRGGLPLGTTRSSLQSCAQIFGLPWRESFLAGSGSCSHLDNRANPVADRRYCVLQSTKGMKSCNSPQKGGHDGVRE